MPVDHFLGSLASHRGNKAIGVVLSGNAADGTLGLKAIEAAGGIAFAQDEEDVAEMALPRRIEVLHERENEPRFLRQMLGNS